MLGALPSPALQSSASLETRVINLPQQPSSGTQLAPSLSHNSSLLTTCCNEECNNNETTDVVELEKLQIAATALTIVLHYPCPAPTLVPSRPCPRFDCPSCQRPPQQIKQHTCPSKQYWGHTRDLNLLQQPWGLCQRHLLTPSTLGHCAASLTFSDLCVTTRCLIIRSYI